MHLPILTIALAASLLAHNVHARAPANLPVTNNILQLRTAPFAPHHIPPSSQHLARRRNPSNNTKRQDNDRIEEPLLTLGGRLYLVDVSIGSRLYTLVIDTGSSDTWLASSEFQCLHPNMQAVLDVGYCGFGETYEKRNSSTWEEISNQGFSVTYAGGEFLRGELGIEAFGIGDAGLAENGVGLLVVNQTIGVVERGFWLGDGISAGLMGLAYSSLVSGAGKLGYESVMVTLTNASPSPNIFALALRRTTPSNPIAGGVLAIGGIPDIPYDGGFTIVPIQPAVQDIYAYYTINVDGFDIASPPSPSSHFSPSSRTRLMGDTPTIVDSGTSLMYFPDQITDRIASLFRPRAEFNPHSGLYIVRCDAVAPRVGVVIGGRTFYVHEDDLMNRGPGAVGGAGVGAGPGYCVLATQRAEGGSVVLGDSWLKGVLVVFDLEENEIRVAARENC